MTTAVNEHEKISTPFDDIDVLYLANNLTLIQLRQEIHHAEIQAKVYAAFEGTEFADPTPFPWQEYAQACRWALDAIKNKPRQPEPRPRGYMRIDIAKLKEQTDIVAVVSRYTTLKKSGRNFTALCPFHAEKQASFYVYPEQQNWHCFGACCTGGDVIAFVMRVENCGFRRACEILQQGVV